VNAVQQRSHRTVTQDHEARIEALELLVEALEKRGMVVGQLADNCDWLKTESDKADVRINHCVEHLNRLSETIDMHDNNLHAIESLGIATNDHADEVDAFLWRSSILARLKWLFLGR
jgi:hypothetical protein